MTDIFNNIENYFNNKFFGHIYGISYLLLAFIAILTIFIPFVFPYRCVRWICTKKPIF